MSQTETFDTLKSSICDVLNNPSLLVEPQSKLVGDLGLESIDFLDLSSEIENSFGFELDFKEVVAYLKETTGKNLDIKDVTVQNILDIISNKTANA